MKTFQKYLLSYLTTLMLPIVVLSFIIFQYILQFCGTQLVERNESALKQLSEAVAMQTEQITAYNLQTTQMPAFLSRTLKNRYANFYDVQGILSDWQFTSGFFSSVYFFQPEMQMVYRSNAVYDLCTFVQLKLQPEDEAAFERTLQSLVAGKTSCAWLLGNEGLYYLSSVKSTSASSHLLICEIEQQTLAEMISNSSYYDNHATYLCDGNGQILFSLDTGAALTKEDVFTIAQQSHPTGDTSTSQGVMLYAKSPSPQNSLLYINVIPQNVAYQAIYRLRTIFWIAILALLALGAVVIYMVMRVNYKPLHDLQIQASESAGLTGSSGDALKSVHEALNVLKSHNTSIVCASAALEKEQLIFKLLLGGYATPEAFNADAEPQRIRIEGDLWRVLVLYATHEAYDDENFASELIAQTLAVLKEWPRPLYIEIPENRSVVFIISQTGQMPDEQSLPDVLGQRLARLGYEVRVAVSPVHNSLASLAVAYTSLASSLLSEPSSGITKNYISNTLDAMRNAIEFNESERIRFTLRSLSDAFPAGDSLLLSDILYIARKALEDEGDEAGLEQLRSAMRAALGGQQPAPALLQPLFQTVSDLLAERALHNRVLEGERLTDDIMRYLSDNATRCDFTVQSVADHFHLSISNLSHYFKNHTGQSVSAVVEGLRIQVAKQLLLTTDESIAQISPKVGYYQPSSFMRAFKRVTDQTPSDFRACAQEQSFHS